MKMHGKRLFVVFLATLFVSVCAAFGRGGTMHKSSDRTTNVTFATAVKLRNSTTLPAGTYRMEVPENTQTPTVTFSQGNKIVATTPANVVTEPNKNPSTEIDTVQDGGTENVTAIRPSGWKEALQFTAAGQ